MARIADQLWKYNLAKITVVDVSDDYKMLLDPLPCSMYPVLKETWVPKYRLPGRLLDMDLVNGYHYDWHEVPDALDEIEHWYVGVVDDAVLALETPIQA
ncbi:MAG: hypothetical protein U0R49_09025 [Fimbriimonadales bacterium]